MIRGIHGLLFSSDPEATRAFFRDLVQLPGSDVGGGWWIFDFREGDLGVHPVGDPADAGTHDVSLYCDDLEETVATLKSRGVHFTGPIEERSYGRVTHLAAPGGVTVQLYQPRYVKGGPAKKPRRRASTPKAPRGRGTRPKARRSARRPSR